jgi:hypothetical protein
MMYCSVEEAYSAPFNNNKHVHHNRTEESNNSNKIPVEIDNDFPYFSVQGGLVGTSIEDLKQLERNNFHKDDKSLETSYSFLDKKYKKKISHNQCINKFVKSITREDSDMFSLASSQDDDVYDHLKYCKYCRTKINMKIKVYYLHKLNKKKSRYTKRQNYKHLSYPRSREVSRSILKSRYGQSTSFFGYNSHDIIVTGVIIILTLLILDMILKFGKNN